MGLLNNSWPHLKCPKCFMHYHGPGGHRCPTGPLMCEDDGVSLVNHAHPRPWHWWISGLWYRLFPPKLNEASVESVLISIRRQVDADGKKIRIKPTHFIRDKRDE